MMRGQSGRAVVLGVLAALVVALAAGSAGAETYTYTGSNHSKEWTYKHPSDKYINWNPDKNYPNSYSDKAIIILSNVYRYPISLSTTILLGGSIGGTYGDYALYIGPNAGDSYGVALTISGTLGMQGNISNDKTIVISGTLRNDSGTTNPNTPKTDYTISGGGSLSLQGGTIGTLYGGGWIFNQNVTGWGTISAPVTNNATISASGGTLTLKDYTFSGGQINPSSTGTIALSKATLNNTTLGAGTVNTVSGTTNAFTGTVTSSATLGIVSGSTLNVSGTFSSTGPVTVSGIYNSNGANQSFNTITINSSGYITATAGSTFTVSGDFLNYSTQNNSWNTTQATLEFVSPTGSGTHSHTLALAGLDYGQVPYGNTNPGYTNNYAWGTLSIAENGSLTLTDGNSGNASTALYVGVIQGVVITEGVVTNISGDFNIYYDPTLPGNEYLHGGTYKLAGNSLYGYLKPSAVPLPGSVWLLGSGLVGLLLVCRRRRRRI